MISYLILKSGSPTLSTPLLSNGAFLSLTYLNLASVHQSALAPGDFFSLGPLRCVVLVMTRRSTLSAVVLLGLASSGAALSSQLTTRCAHPFAQQSVLLRPDRQTAASAENPPEPKSKVSVPWLLSLFKARKSGWWTSLLNHPSGPYSGAASLLGPIARC